MVQPWGPPAEGKCRESVEMPLESCCAGFCFQCTWPWWVQCPPYEPAGALESGDGQGVGWWGMGQAALPSSDLPVLCPSEAGRCCRELPEGPPLAGQHQGKKHLSALHWLSMGHTFQVSVKNPCTDFLKRATPWAGPAPARLKGGAGRGAAPRSPRGTEGSGSRSGSLCPARSAGSHRCRAPSALCTPSLAGGSHEWTSGCQVVFPQGGARSLESPWAREATSNFGTGSWERRCPFPGWGPGCSRQRSLLLCHQSRGDTPGSRGAAGQSGLGLELSGAGSTLP